jgi:tetraacyldisaccharide 4'-kinase
VSRLFVPASWVFRAGVACRSFAYRKGWLATRRLSKPVVSVGNLSVGGTGKTPFVAYLAERLLARGRRPAILTRGYRRETSTKLVVLEPVPGRAPDPREVGDEPALLARMLPTVPIIVSADRYRAGREAEERFEVDTHILDDGFQHLGLARALDIILLDATENYDAGLIPAGRLRERLSALSRAGIVILTRTEIRDSGFGIRGSGMGTRETGVTPRSRFPTLDSLVEKWAPEARVFRAETDLAGLRIIPDGFPQDDADFLSVPSFAFCGVGNPQAFFRDLARWGFHLVGQKIFPDHHRYSPRELAELDETARSSGAEALLTTEKDAMNLYGTKPGGMPTLACSMAMRLDEPEAFEEALFSRLGGIPVNTR